MQLSVLDSVRENPAASWARYWGNRRFGVLGVTAMHPVLLSPGCITILPSSSVQSSLVRRWLPENYAFPAALSVDFWLGRIGLVMVGGIAEHVVAGRRYPGQLGDQVYLRVPAFKASTNCCMYSHIAIRMYMHMHRYKHVSIWILDAVSISILCWQAFLSVPVCQ